MRCDRKTDIPKTHISIRMLSIAHALIANVTVALIGVIEWCISPDHGTTSGNHIHAIDPTKR